MSPPLVGAARVRAGFPRVSGDEPAGAQAIRDGAEFSPRERG